MPASRHHAAQTPPRFHRPAILHRHPPPVARGRCQSGPAGRQTQVGIGLLTISPSAPSAEWLQTAPRFSRTAGRPWRASRSGSCRSGPCHMPPRSVSQGGRAGRCMQATLTCHRWKVTLNPAPTQKTGHAADMIRPLALAALTLAPPCPVAGADGVRHPVGRAVARLDHRLGHAHGGHPADAERRGGNLLAQPRRCRHPARCSTGRGSDNIRALRLHWPTPRCSLQRHADHRLCPRTGPAGGNLARPAASPCGWKPRSIWACAATSACRPAVAVQRPAGGAQARQPGDSRRTQGAAGNGARGGGEIGHITARSRRPPAACACGRSWTCPRLAPTRWW
jgi:hypothetical protein